VPSRIDHDLPHGNLEIRPAVAVDRPIMIAPAPPKPP
jgi:hypothetical protein